MGKNLICSAPVSVVLPGALVPRSLGACFGASPLSTVILLNEAVALHY